MDFDISDSTSGDNSLDMDTSDMSDNDTVDFGDSEITEAESLEPSADIEALDLSDEDVSDLPEDMADVEAIDSFDADEIESLDYDPENGMEESAFDEGSSDVDSLNTEFEDSQAELDASPDAVSDYELSDSDGIEDTNTEPDEALLDSMESEEMFDDEEIEALEADDAEESDDLPTDEVAAAEEEILELGQENAEAEIQIDIDQAALEDTTEAGEEDVPDFDADLSGSDPDPLDYGDESLETEVEDIPSVPIIDDAATDIPELDAGEEESTLDSSLSDADDTEENEESVISGTDTELPDFYPNPQDYDVETDEAEDEIPSMPEAEELDEALSTEIVDDIDDNENPDNPETSFGYPDQAEFEEEAEEEDGPKTLVREITPEILESRQADMEETLDNYRENLRDRGVEEEAIASFIQEERENMLREYESLDRRDKDPYVYHDPTDWDAVAAALSDSESIETAESDELPSSDDLSANPEEIEAEEPIEDEIDQPSSELAEEDLEDDLESVLDEVQETPEDVMEEDQDVIEPEDVDYDAVFQEMTPDELEEGYQDIELDEDPEQYTVVLESFENDTWEELSLDDRKTAMEDMAAFIGDKIHLENPPKIEYYYNEQPGDYGGYRPGDNVLQVNEYMLYQADEAADTIAHELWHAHQHECADNPRSERDYQYRYNFQNYVRHDISPERYRSQLVEAEAYAFAGQIKTKLQEMQRMKG